MRRTTQAAIALTLLGQSVVGWGNPWDKDMVDQPIAKAQRSVAPAGPDAIPVVGGETLPAPTTEAGMFEAKDEARESLRSKEKEFFSAGRTPVHFPR